jgi:hypothetical protein
MLQEEGAPTTGCAYRIGFANNRVHCTKWSCKTLFEMEDTDILYTNNHVVTYVPDPNQTFRL